jgi:hypothetical protein
MTNIISCYLMGGLGNQLFQIFSTISYGHDNQRNIIFPYTESLTTGVTRPTYWNNFLSSLISFTNYNTKYTNNQLTLFHKYTEQNFHFSPIDKSNLNEIILYGYFQSYKYFQHNTTHICSLLNLNTQQNTILNDYSLLFPNDKNIVSMHFRIGDYKDIQKYHPLLPYQYYENAISKLDNNITNIQILYFCEKKDNHTVSTFIQKLQHKFNNIQFVKVDDDIPDWKQLLIMSCCSHNIIANSSFSWWGAFFNQNTNKLVYYPHKWFGPALNHHNTQDLIPNNWNKILYELE